MQPLSVLVLFSISTAMVSSTTANTMLLTMMAATLPTNIVSIRCWLDNQGIPVKDQAHVISEFKDFDCGLGGGKQKNCLKITKEVDGEMLTFRNCGVEADKQGCKTDAANVTRCYCSQDFCNSSNNLKITKVATLTVGLVLTRLLAT